MGEIKSIAAVVVELATAQFDFAHGPITVETMINDVGDSLDLVELAMAIEEELHVELLDSRLNGVITIQDLITAAEEAREPA